MTSEALNAAMAAHLDNLTKPKGSLGRLEDYAMKLARIQGRVPPRSGKKAVYVIAADHGITAAGVSAYPKEVTLQMTLNVLSGGAAINALARGCGWEVVAVDAGIDGDFPAKPELLGTTRFLDRKLGRGSRNFAVEDALSEAECEAALAAGAALAQDAVERGYEMVAIGDMGIGNTSAAAALLVGLGFGLDEVVDRGTGIDDEALERKRRTIAAAALARGPCATAKDALRKFGGFDLTVMAGFALALKDKGIALIMDGFPVSSAVFAAFRMDAAVADYAFAGHKSKVKGHKPILDAMGLEPIVSLDMRLGEGTGAVIGGFLVELGAKAAAEMASFDAVGVSKSEGDERKY